MTLFEQVVHVRFLVHVYLLLYQQIIVGTLGKWIDWIDRVGWLSGLSGPTNWGGHWLLMTSLEVANGLY